jgi:hypothetical protein
MNLTQAVCFENLCYSGNLNLFEGKIENFGIIVFRLDFEFEHLVKSASFKVNSEVVHQNFAF